MEQLTEDHTNGMFFKPISPKGRCLYSQYASLARYRLNRITACINNAGHAIFSEAK